MLMKVQVFHNLQNQHAGRLVSVEAHNLRCNQGQYLDPHLFKDGPMLELVDKKLLNSFDLYGRGDSNSPWATF